MNTKITITTAGTSISPTLDLYSNELGYWTFFQNVPLNDLLLGYIFTLPIGATAFQVRDTGICETILELTCGEAPLTTTTTSSFTTSTPVEETFNVTIYGHPSEPTIDTGNVYYSIDAGPDILLGTLGTNMCRFIGIIPVPSGSTLHLGVLNGTSSCIDFNVVETTDICPAGNSGYCGTVNTCTGYTTFFPVLGSFDISITANCTGGTYQTCP
jgi:hypothetical protein